MGGLLHLVHAAWRGLGELRPRPVTSSLYQNVTAHPSTADGQYTDVILFDVVGYCKYLKGLSIKFKHYRSHQT